jgi:putative transposon-encoded protein
MAKSSLCKYIAGVGLTLCTLLVAATGSAEAAGLRKLLISPTALDFGDVHVGTASAVQSITITNMSSTPIVGSIAGGAAGLFGGSQNCQGVTINPGQSCQISYAFSPTAVGPATATASGSFNGQPFQFALAGNGIRRWRISPTSLDFGDVAVGMTSPSQTVTITNVSSTAVMGNILGGAAGLFGGAQNCQGVTINPGQSCQIFYSFRPTALGSVTGSTTGSFNNQPFSFTFAGKGYKGARGDLDADGISDLSFYRPSTGQWFVLKSSTDFTTSTTKTFGTSTDRPVPGDYDGDGINDFAVFRPSTGQWLVLTSSSNFVTTITTQWGNSTDIPVPGDYDGDGKTDLAVFRPSDGTWYIIYSSTGVAHGFQWGNSADTPVPGDYDGDGKTDTAIFRPSDGTWYIIYSSTQVAHGIQWGNSADVTAQADYDGDGKIDIAVFRPSDGTWYIINSSTSAITSVVWGNGADIMVPADYDGDGKADVAVFRPSDGTWYIIYSSTGVPHGIQWGTSTDIPIPETYLGRWIP